MKRNVLTALLSLAIAFALWMYVIIAVNPEFEDTYEDIRVSLEGEGILEERGLMITSVANPEVSLKLKGNRTYLVELNSNNISVVADVSKITRAGAYNVGFEERFPGNIPDNAIEVQTRNPDAITIVVEEKIAKPVDVVIDYGGTNVPEGFICDKEGILYGDSGAFVTVSGPKSVIDRITQAVISIDLTDRRESIIEESFVFTLCDAGGSPVDAEMVKTNVGEVDLTLRIQRYKDITLKVEVIDGGGATEKTSAIKIDPEKIRISGNDILLDKIEDVMVIGTIDLSKLLEDTQLTFPITLPDSVTNETNVTEAVVDVKFPNLQIKTLSVSNIVPINVPEGLEVDMITQKLEIKFRGPIAMVQKIKLEDISVTVDFANAELGTATIRADVAINSNFKDVGIVGTYQVSATLQEPVEELAE